MSDSLRGGGAQRVCVNIANGLIELGWKVDLVILNLNDQNYLDQLSKKVNLVELNVNHVRYSSVSLLKYIYKKKPNLFLVFNYELTVILILLRKLLNLKFKIITRNISTLSQKKIELKKTNFWVRNIVSYLIDNFYHKSDHIVNQCYAMNKDMVKLNPNTKKNSSVIYNPLANHILEYVKRNDIKKIKKKDYLLCIGSLKKPNAFHYAIEGFAGIIDKFPNLRLKIVGKGNLEKELKHITKNFGIARYVDFEGFQKNIIPYYLYARATIQTSHYEGYPNVLIESIAMNTPVVAFDCPGGTKEIIKNGINGYLVKQHSVEDLKKKLLKLLSNEFNYKDLKMSIINNQIEHICKNYEKIIYSYL